MANVIVSGVAVINSLAETDRIRAEEYNSKALTGKSKVEGRRGRRPYFRQEKMW